MRKLLYLAAFIFISLAALVVAGGSQAASDDSPKAPSPSEIGGVWKGYLYPQAGAQVRVYAVFRSSGTETSVQLLTPSSPWVEDSQALCVLAQSSECGKAVSFSDVSGQLALAADGDGGYAGDNIKISGDAQKLRFSLKKAGADGSVQEFTGVLENHLRA
ncbi:MAG: hypothetical protein GX410_10255 [Elusimicrobia bacterium]|nr:hypothetical protein [Elusimicrobiota bacterium]